MWGYEDIWCVSGLTLQSDFIKFFNKNNRGRKCDDEIFLDTYFPLSPCSRLWASMTVWLHSRSSWSSARRSEQSWSLQGEECHVSCVMCHVSCVMSCICRAVLNQDIRVKGVSLDIDGGKCLPARIKCPHNQKYFTSETEKRVYFVFIDLWRIVQLFRTTQWANLELTTSKSSPLYCIVSKLMLVYKFKNVKVKLLLLVSKVRDASKLRP